MFFRWQRAPATRPCAQRSAILRQRSRAGSGYRHTTLMVTWLGLERCAVCSSRTLGGCARREFAQRCCCNCVRCPTAAAARSGHRMFGGRCAALPWWGWLPSAAACIISLVS